jgi:4'-phosphopantetheinyl transferase
MTAPITSPLFLPVWSLATLDDADRQVPALAENDIHLWQFGLDRPQQEVRRGALSLSEDELARAARFRSPALTARFVIGRAVLREVLARYCGCAPAGLHFSYDAHGKPALDIADFHFNLSHSEDVALLGVARRPIGVDVERVRPIPDALAIAGRFFSRAEVIWLAALPPAAVEPAFVVLWTRKEALLKGVGRGLSQNLDSYDVFGPRGASLQVSAENAAWLVRDAATAPDILAAAAVRG